MHFIDWSSFSQHQFRIPYQIVNRIGQLFAWSKLGHESVLLQLQVAQITGHEELDWKKHLSSDFGYVVEHVHVVFWKKQLESLVDLRQPL